MNNATGSINQSWVPGVGIFTGTAGVVTIAQPVSAMGLQFITDGYQVTSAGSALTMVALPDGSMPFIRVDPGATVDIGAEIAGTAGLLKADAGTLILSGTSSYGRHGDRWRHAAAWQWRHQRQHRRRHHR